MFKALRNLTLADKRALAVFFAIAFICAIYFASGILVSYVSPPADLLEIAANGKGTMVEISNIPSYDSATQIGSKIREIRRIDSNIEYSPTGFGYIIRVGPFTRREMAEQLANELKSVFNNLITLREVCPVGPNCPPSGRESTDERRGERPPPVTVGPVGPVGSSGSAGSFSSAAEDSRSAAPTDPTIINNQNSQTGQADPSKPAGQKSGEKRP